MFESQHFVDLQENSTFGDPKSWLSGEDNLSPTHRRTLATAAAATASAGSNVDRVLFNDLVEIVPLVQSLIDRKASSSFTRRGSVIYTKTPSRESLSRKITDPKGRNAAQSIPTKKKRDNGDKDQSKTGGNNQDGENFSIFSSRALATEQDNEELDALRAQVEDLQRKLSEKDELLKSAEMSKNEMSSVHAKLDELKRLAAEKDSLVKSTQLQLSDAKIKLADKQAALEKIQWEAMTSGRKVDKLQEELQSMQGEISSYLLLFEGLSKTDSTAYAEDYDFPTYHFDHLPNIDDLDDMEIQKMEKAKEAYIHAVAVAKQKQDEESVAAAARARSYLQSFVFRSGNIHPSR